MTSVFVKADPPEPEALILLKPEPLDSVMGKWLAWILTLVIFLLGLIYFSTSFAKSDIPCIEKEYHVLDDEDKDQYYSAQSINRYNNRNTSSADHVPHLDVGQDAVQFKQTHTSNSSSDVSFNPLPNSVKSVSKPVVADENIRSGFTAIEILDDDYCDEYDVYGNCVAPFTPLAIGGFGGYYGFGGRRLPHLNPHLHPDYHRRFPHIPHPPRFHHRH